MESLVVVKIAIAGPGRSGTSVLVRLFAEWGFSVPPLDGNWHEEAQAGLETRIGENSGYEVDKDPWAYEYLDRVSLSRLTEYAALLVPIRNRQDVAISRSVQERASRALHSESDHWRWDSWATVAGGAVSQTDIEGITGTLARGLWDLLEKATAAGLTPTLLNFPRFVYDFVYLWSQVAPIVEQRQSKESAFEAWMRVSDPRKVRIGNSDSAATRDVRIQELQALVDMLRKENLQMLATCSDAIAQQDDAIAQRDDAIAQRDDAIAQRDDAIAQRDEIANSRIWRSTGWYRKLRHR